MMSHNTPTKGHIVHVSYCIFSCKTYHNHAVPSCDPDLNTGVIFEQSCTYPTWRSLHINLKTRVTQCSPESHLPCCSSSEEFHPYCDSNLAPYGDMILHTICGCLNYVMALLFRRRLLKRLYPLHSCIMYNLIPDFSPNLTPGSKKIKNNNINSHNSEMFAY